MRKSEKNKIIKKKETHGVKEIARRANVSIATVDRVLHNRSGVSPSTKRRIERIIKELDYQPNILASRLASKKVYNFAVLIPKVSEETTFWQAPLKGIQRAESTIKGYGIKIKIHFFDLKDRNSFEKEAHKILEDKPDGVLLAPSFIKEALHFTTLFNESKIPYVLIDSNIPGREGLCYIGPHLFRSGFLSAQLMHYSQNKDNDILAINIAKELDDHNYLSQIEDGFKAYFNYHNLYRNIINLNIIQTDYLSVEKELEKTLKKYPNIKAIFVTNSRVSTVAKFLEEKNKSGIFLIGFDYLKDNIEYLKEDVINVLICHKPNEQGFKGIMTLYRHLVLGEEVEKVHFMPIDIITKENYEFYHN